MGQPIFLYYREAFFSSVLKHVVVDVYSVGFSSSPLPQEFEKFSSPAAYVDDSMASCKERQIFPLLFPNLFFAPSEAVLKIQVGIFHCLLLRAGAGKSP